LGKLGVNSYEEIFGGPVLRQLVRDSITDGMPGCADCAYLPYCGADPIENHATQRDTVGHRPTSEFCSRNMGIINHLLRLYHGADSYLPRLFHGWTRGVPTEALFPVAAA
jgi:hypothetical protein